MKRKLDPDRCPICRNGQLGVEQLERPLVFCPVCRTKPLKEESRKRLGLLTELSWVCDHCKTELDLGLLKGAGKLTRNELDPFGVAAKYAGQTLPVKFWLSIAPRCGVRRGIVKSCG